MKNSEIISECRRVSRLSGLTFKRSNMNINNHPAYHFSDRTNGRIVLENCTLSSAYDNVCSGFIESYNKELCKFNGVNIYK